MHCIKHARILVLTDLHSPILSHILSSDEKCLLGIFLYIILNGKNISKFEDSFTKCRNENSDKGYKLEVDAEYHKKLHDSQMDLLFLQKRRKIEEYQKVVYCFHDEEKYVAYLRTLKQALNHTLI